MVSEHCKFLYHHKLLCLVDGKDNSHVFFRHGFDGHGNVAQVIHDLADFERTISKIFYDSCKNSTKFLALPARSQFFRKCFEAQAD